MTETWICPSCHAVMPGPDVRCSGSFIDTDHPPNVEPVRNVTCPDCRGLGDKGFPPRECQRCDGAGTIFVRHREARS